MPSGLSCYRRSRSAAVYLAASLTNEPTQSRKSVHHPERNVLRSLHSVVLVGLHAFRRYRTEVLRRAGCPEDLVRMWLGHAPTSVTDMYALGLLNDESRRREWCERVGLGFNLLGIWATWATNPLKILSRISLPPRPQLQCRVKLVVTPH